MVTEQLNGINEQVKNHIKNLFLFGNELIVYLRFYYYYWVDASADGLLRVSSAQ
jgi:hypothetical protein